MRQEDTEGMPRRWGAKKRERNKEGGKEACTTAF